MGRRSVREETLELHYSPIKRPSDHALSGSSASPSHSANIAIGRPPLRARISQAFVNREEIGSESAAASTTNQPPPWRAGVTDVSGKPKRSSHGFRASAAA